MSRILRFSFIALLLSSAAFADPPTATAYQARVDQVEGELESAVHEDLNEGMFPRLFYLFGNGVRWSVQRVASGAMARPYGKTRGKFYDATVLLREISEDVKLTEAERLKLQNELAGHISDGIVTFTQPYADPADLAILDNCAKVGNKIGRAACLAAMGVVWAVGINALRDLALGILPYNFDVRESRMREGVSFPRAMPFFGQDARRNSILGGVGNDMIRVFKPALKDPEKNLALSRSLEKLMEGVSVSEPVQFASIQSLALAIYAAVQIWFVINPQPELSLEPTVYGPLLSAIAYGLIFQGLKVLRKSNSGYSFFQAYRRLTQPGSSWVGRRIEAFKEPFRGIGKLLRGDLCGRALGEMSRNTVDRYTSRFRR